VEPTLDDACPSSDVRRYGTSLHGYRRVVAEPHTRDTSTPILLRLRRHDRTRYVLARYSIIMDGRTIGRLEPGGLLEVLVEPGDHCICARSLLSVSPAHRFTATCSPLDMECGFAGSRNIVRFGIGPTMKWVRFDVAGGAASR
jgi:hypothetical protein